MSVITVLFEATALGTAEVRSSEARTGVYTYVRNLALALHASEAVRLLPICSSPLYLNETLVACQSLGLDLVVLLGQQRPLGLPRWLPWLWQQVSQHTRTPGWQNPATKLAGKLIKALVLLPLWSLHVLLPLGLQANHWQRHAEGGALLHDPHWTSSWYGLLRVLGLCPLPRCVSLHDMLPLIVPQYFDDKITFRFHWFVRSLLNSDHLIAVSRHTAEDFWRSQPQRRHQPLTVTHLAPSERFVPGAAGKADGVDLLGSLGLEPGGYVMSLCTLEPRKNIERLLAAFAELVQRSACCERLVLVGAIGWKMPCLQAQIAALGLEDHVVLTGYLPDQQLPTLLAHCAVFVYPSLYEGFGLPVVEAMACGCAVITSNTSSLLEVFADSALVVDPTDTTALATAIGRVLADPALQQALRTSSLAKAASLTWAKTAAATLAAYRQAVAPGLAGR